MPRIRSIESTTVTGEPGPRRLVVGEAYTRDEIHALLGGSKRACLPTKDGAVLAACLLKSFNPEAPRVVLCGTGPRNGAMGELLARQRSALPMFIKAGVGCWLYHGFFRVTRSSTEGAVFERHLARSGRARSSVSRVVLLAPA